MIKAVAGNAMAVANAKKYEAITANSIYPNIAQPIKTKNSNPPITSAKKTDHFHQENPRLQIKLIGLLDLTGFDTSLLNICINGLHSI